MKAADPAVAGVAEVAGPPVLERARRYVEQETPSGAGARIAQLALIIEEELIACGATVERLDAGSYGRNVLARVPGREESLPPLLVLAHIDTVHPVGTLAQRPFRVDDGRAYGPGIYDMKTGLAVVVEALTRLHDAGRGPRRPVHLLITCDEEIGSHSAHDLILEQARAAAAVLVPEPCMPDGGVKTFRKGVATYSIRANGRAAHAGIEGATAVSAISELVYALADALRLANHERGTTINIGTITGGTASNVVAAQALAQVDVRLAEPAEGERVHGALLALRARHPDAAVRVERTESRPPLVRSDAVVALYRKAREVAASLGVDLMEGGTGGGSDGSIAASTGVATLDGLGPRGGGAHAEDEHIIIDDLPFRLAFMTALLEAL
ncbi:M20 family metallopeptidase [soil metagenome]